MDKPSYWPDGRKLLALLESEGCEDKHIWAEYLEADGAARQFVREHDRVTWERLTNALVRVKDTAKYYLGKNSAFTLALGGLLVEALEDYEA